MNNELSPLGIDTAIRLRLICRMLCLENSIPCDDSELMASQFSVFGMMRRSIEQLKSKISEYQINEVDGATIPKDGAIGKWLASDEGKETVRKSLAESAADLAALKEARKVSLVDMNTPMGLMPEDPVLSDEQPLQILENLIGLWFECGCDKNHNFIPEAIWDAVNDARTILNGCALLAKVEKS